MNDRDFRDYVAQLKRDVANVSDKTAHIERVMQGAGRSRRRALVHQHLVTIREFLRGALAHAEREAERRAAARGGRFAWASALRDAPQAVRVSEESA